MRRVTRHALDTCDCVRLFEWDDADDPRVETPLEKYVAPSGEEFVAFRCEAHAGLADPVEHTNTIMEENRRKNETMAEVLRSFPQLTKQDRATGDQVVSDALVQWSFDPRTRELLLDVPTLTASEKQALDDATDERVSVR